MKIIRKEEDVSNKESTFSKKKKQKKNPWGKKERFVIIGILFLTAFSSAILAISARSWKLPGFPKLKAPSFEFEKTYVYEKDIIKKSDENIEKIKEIFKKETNKLSGVYAFEVVLLDTNVVFGVNEQTKLQAASLIKLPVMALLYEKAQTGSLDLDYTYTLKNSDKKAGSGSLYSKPEGTKITYRNLAQLMGKESDNTAFAIAVDILGEEEIESFIKRVGMYETSLSENTTTPYDIGIFFKKLWSGDILNHQYKEELLNSLTDTIYEDYLPKGIPEEIDVSHKYGRELHVLNDAGIVRSEPPFVLVLMSEGIVESEAEKIFPILSRKLYQEITSLYKI